MAKIPVRIVGQPWQGHAVGSVVDVSLGRSRLMANQGTAELVNAPKAKKAVKKTAVKKAAAKKAPAKKSVVGSRNRSMRGQTTTK